MQESSYKTVGELAGINKESTQVEKKKPRLFGVIMIVGITLILGVSWIAYTRSKDFQIKNAEAARLSSAVELNDLETFTQYRGNLGGLYLNNSNEPSKDQQILIQNQLKKVKPLDKTGKSKENGKIGFVYIGDPYTQGEFKEIADYVRLNSEINKNLVLIDGALQTQNTEKWNKSSFPWGELSKQLQESKITPPQVQVFWVNFSSDEYTGNFSDDNIAYRESVTGIIQKALSKYPNTKVVYLSSPRYAGFSENRDFQEPSAYEAGFGVRDIIGAQENGSLVLGENNTKISSEAALVWGPYIWNPSTEGGQDFSYARNNYAADGITLLPVGKQRYSVDVVNFFRDYEFSKSWFATQ